MRKIPFTLLLCHALTAIFAQQHFSNTVAEQIKKVENGLSPGLVVDGKWYTLEERMKHFNVTGVSVAVIDNYQIVWARGYGFADKQEGRLVTPATMFEPGSISKSLNAVGILLLAQQGKLDLNEDINKYLVHWKFPYDTVSHGRKITAAQLLSHTAGLTVHGFPGYHRDSVIASVPDILDGRGSSNTEAVRSLAEPGIGPRYSGGGTVITQQMLTDITGQPYEQYLGKQVLARMGMKNSSFRQPPTGLPAKQLATGYKRDGSEVPGKYHVYPEQAAAGLWTTPTDICKYIIEMQQAYQGKSSKVLNQEMVKLHVTPVKQDAAMGTFLQERGREKYFSHTASNEGFSGLFIGGLTNGKGAAIFANSDDAPVIFELMTSIALAYQWEGFNKPEEITTVTVNDTVSARYVGEYIMDGIFSGIRKEKDGLYFWQRGISSKMHFLSPTVFRNIEFGPIKAFISDSAGGVTGFSNTWRNRPLPNSSKINSIDTLKPKPGQWASFGRYLLESGNYGKAISYLSKGLPHESPDSWLVKDLAHAYLFNGDFTKSIELYRQFLAPVHNRNRKILADDFEILRKAGFDRTLIQKAGDTLLLHNQ